MSKYGVPSGGSESPLVCWGNGSEEERGERGVRDVHTGARLFRALNPRLGSLDLKCLQAGVLPRYS